MECHWIVWQTDRMYQSNLLLLSIYKFGLPEKYTFYISKCLCTRSKWLSSWLGNIFFLMLKYFVSLVPQQSLHLNWSLNYSSILVQDVGLIFGSSLLLENLEQLKFLTIKNLLGKRALAVSNAAKIVQFFIASAANEFHSQSTYFHIKARKNS